MDPGICANYNLPIPPRENRHLGSPETPLPRRAATASPDAGSSRRRSRSTARPVSSRRVTSRHHPSSPVSGAFEPEAGERGVRFFVHIGFGHQIQSPAACPPPGFRNSLGRFRVAAVEGSQVRLVCIAVHWKHWKQQLWPTSSLWRSW